MNRWNRSENIMRAYEDWVIEAMGEIGKQMPCALKETAQGGLAATPTGRRIQADFL